MKELQRSIFYNKFSNRQVNIKGSEKIKIFSRLYHINLRTLLDILSLFNCAYLSIFAKITFINAYLAYIFPLVRRYT